MAKVIFCWLIVIFAHKTCEETKFFHNFAA